MSKNPNLDELRFALAINRGMQMMNEKTSHHAAINNKFEALLKPTANHTYQSPEDVLYRCHEMLFDDWRRREQNVLVKSAKRSSDRQKISEIIRDLLWDKKNGLLGPNNDVVHQSPDELASVLAHFYVEMVKLHPFEYGNHLTIELFLTLLFEQKPFKQVYGYDGIDFRRITKEQAAKMHGSDPNFDEIKEVFSSALDGNLTPKLENPRTDDKFAALPDNHITIGAIPFLGHKKEATLKFQVSKFVYGIISKSVISGNIDDALILINDVFNATFQKSDIDDLDILSSKLLDAIEKKYNGISDKFKAFLKDVLAAGHDNPLLEKYKSEENHSDEYIVTVNGGLIPRYKVEVAVERLRDNDNLVADLPNFKADEFLDGTEKLQQKNEIDGIVIGADGSAPLCCLDADIITGLRSDYQQMLEKHFNAVTGGNLPFPFALNGDTGLKKLLIDAAGSNANLIRCVEIAYDRVSRVVKKMDDTRDEKLNKKHPSDKPQFFMSMGGGGSGKSVVERMIRKICDDNFVEATLDGFRQDSDLYHLLIAANHHADDYIMVESFAANLRDWVAKAARAKGMNVLYDCTGIPYEGKYKELVRSFKDKSYETWVCAVDNTIERSIENIIRRMFDIKRILPWRVVKEKHQQFPLSFMAAADDTKIDHLCLFANDGGPDEHKLIAEIDRTSRDAPLLAAAKAGSNLFSALSNIISELGSAALKLLDETKNKPEIKADNVDILALANNSGSVLRVYDAKRVAQMMRKGQLNTDVSDDKDLNKPSTDLKFLVPGKNSFSFGLSI